MLNPIRPKPSTVSVNIFRLSSIWIERLASVGCSLPIKATTFGAHVLKRVGVKSSPSARSTHAKLRL